MPDPIIGGYTGKRDSTPIEPIASSDLPGLSASQSKKEYLKQKSAGSAMTPE